MRKCIGPRTNSGRVATVNLNDLRGPNPYLLAGIAILAVVALWVIPNLQLSRQLSRPQDIDGLGPKESFEIENEARKTLAQIFTGIAVLAGLWFTWQQVIGAEDGRITDRYGQAIEQLDATKSMEVRLGGIYALARIGEESQKDTRPIREVLAAFVRIHACWEGPRGDHPCPTATPTAGHATQAVTASPTPTAPGEDVLAAMSVISRLGSVDTTSGSCLNLKYTKLPSIVLRDGNLQNVCFENSYLREADFRGAQLQNSQFGNSNLTGAHFDNANLTKASLNSATLHVASFNRTILDQTSLKRATLGGKQSQDATGLEADQIRRACIDQYTVLPSYLAQDATSFTICTI